MVAIFVVGVAFVAMLAASVIGLFGSGIPALDEQCHGREFSCGVVAGVLTAILPIVVAFAIFMFFGLQRVRGRYRRYAQAHPARLLQATTPLGEIVGRDDLCDVLQQEFERREGDEQFEEGGEERSRRVPGRRRRRQARNRRPVVLVGGVGVGKTAVLVRLTKLLADRGALPVPIRLRDAQHALDFEAMAREKFLREASIVSASEGDTIWRRLRDDDQVIVVADGLEEALTDVVEARETAIQVAFEEARKSDLPLIVASRPHNVLNFLDARVLRLEALAPADALRYVQGQADDNARVQRIVERGEVVEMPLFMQIARQLQDKNLLDEVDTRHVGRLGLRARLLWTWTDALVSGKVESTVPLKPGRRREVVEKLEALACVGLLNDNLEVSFGDVAPDATRVESGPGTGNHDDADAEERRRKIAQLLNGQAATLPATLREVAADGARLQIVDPLKNGIRFRHSTVQAYLGSRTIHQFFDSDVLRKKLASPGRELLMALEMRCIADPRAREEVARLLSDAVCGTRAGRRQRTGVRHRQAQTVGAHAEPGGRGLRNFLFGTTSSDATNPMVGWKAVATAASAVTVHSLMPLEAAEVNGSSRTNEAPHDDRASQIDEVIATAWANATEADTPTIDAKLAAIARIAEAGRYHALWRICCSEPIYRVRLYAVRHLGAGGLAAFRVLEARLRTIADLARGESGRLPRGSDTCRILAEEGVIDSPDEDQQPDRVYELLGLLLPQMYRSVAGEHLPPSAAHLERDAAHLDRDARAAAPASAGAAVEVAEAADHVRGAASAARQSDDREERKKAANAVGDLLKNWIRVIGSHRGYRTSEIGLAQGFKHAANRRPIPADVATRGFLAEQAENLLEKSDFWFVQIGLIQALTLWLLGETDGSPDSVRDATSRIRRWVGESPHPFVKESARLCTLALEQRTPAKYIWVEEVEVVAKLGPSAELVDQTRDQWKLDSERWIPRAGGWLTLDLRAQQLVADVVVLLNLADRGPTNDDREEALQRAAQSHLPPCMQRGGGRAHLRVNRPLDDPTAGPPGSTCHPDCKMRLCPYPAPGESLSRGELDEAFCRAQQSLLQRSPSSKGRRALRPPWQHAASLSELREFWAQMERRRWR